MSSNVAQFLLINPDGSIDFDCNVSDLRSPRYKPRASVDLARALRSRLENTFKQPGSLFLPEEFLSRAATRVRIVHRRLF